MAYIGNNNYIIIKALAEIGGYGVGETKKDNLITKIMQWVKTLKRN